MKLTRRELNMLIESYLSEDLLNERLQAIDTTRYEVPKCNFKFDPKFLGFYEFMKTGKRPPGGSFDDSDKPLFFNPAFTSALQNQMLPFMNLMAVPTFGIKTKCNTMQKMQDMFNEIYDDFTRGFKGAGLGSKPDPTNDKEKDQKFEKNLNALYGNVFKSLDGIMSTNNIQITDSRNNPLITAQSSLTQGITRQELTYASFLLGDLTKARSDHRYEVAKIVENFERNGKSAESVGDLMRLVSPSKNIPGFDENAIRALFTEITNKMDAQKGKSYLGMITDKLFDKLRANGAI